MPFRIGITCYPSVGGSGILATSLGQALAERGHEVHFISYERPVRLRRDDLPITYHPVLINDYGLFKYPDYTLPLSVKMAEVAREYRLDVLHVHYAVPHATAAVLARSMLPLHLQPRIVTTLHGTDTTLLGRDAGYGPAIRYALQCSDAVTAVSQFLREETVRLLEVDRSIDVIYNFCDAAPPQRTVAAVRQELGLQAGDKLVVHSSNLRRLKRIDLLLDTFSQIRAKGNVKLLVLAGADFAPYKVQVKRLGVQDRVVVLPDASVEDYIQAADVGLYTSESESFCLSILEGMVFQVPSVAMRVGGIPEVVEDGHSGILVPFGDVGAAARAVSDLLADDDRRRRMGTAAHERSLRFQPSTIVTQYEALYARVCRAAPAARTAG